MTVGVLLGACVFTCLCMCVCRCVHVRHKGPGLPPTWYEWASNVCSDLSMTRGSKFRVRAVGTCRVCCERSDRPTGASRQEERAHHMRGYIALKVRRVAYVPSARLLC
jgi:hypothetical protein